jgi:hypothetical protein
LDEIQEIIRNLKRLKTPGTDNINTELLQVAGPQMTQRIQDIIFTIRRSERMPNEWNKSIICPIYKKGEKSKCSNYRGISLLSTVYKILATVINNRLTTYAKDLLSQEQNGFRINRSTMDKIFIMRQINVMNITLKFMYCLLILSRLSTMLTDKKPYRYYRK